MSKYAFISYLEDDEEKILTICCFLKRHDIYVWLAKEQQHPQGDVWKTAIDKVIATGGFFLVFCSANSETKDTLHARKELLFANEITRELSINRNWILPIKLTECNIPDFSLNSGINLKDLRCLEII